MPLTFPSALFWLLLAIPLAALYLLKVRPRRQVVSSVWWWQEVIPDSRPRRWWRRLRHPMSLLVQLLLLAIMALALGEPYWRQRPPQRRWIVIVDNSASMQATDVDPDRLTLAKRRVRRVIDSLRGGDQMALLTAGTSVRLVREFTSHASSLRRALDEVRPTDGPDRLAEALEAAHRLAANGAYERQIVIATDSAGQASVERNERDRQRPSAPPPVRWIVCGGVADNIGITQYQVRRQNVDPLGVECLVEVASFASEPRRVRLSLHLGEQLLDVMPLELPPMQGVTRVLSYASAEGGTLRASLDVDDALAADNRAVAWLTPRTPRRMTLVTAGNVYLQKVLTAIPLVELQIASSISPSDDRRPTIIHGMPIDQLPAGRSMLIQPTPAGAPWDVGQMLPESAIARHEVRSPLLTHLQLEDLPARGCRRLRLPENAQVLAATYSGEPVYALVPHSRGETLLLNLDVQEGDFPWRAEFPLLMANAVNWLVRQTADFQPAYAAGEVVSLIDVAGAGPAPKLGSSIDPSVDRGAGAREVVSPDGERLLAPTDKPLTQLGPLDRTGIWSVWPAAATDDETRTVVADDGQSARPAREEAPLQIGCNLVSRDESDLRRQALDVAQHAVLSWNATPQPLWFYLITAALVLMAGEWWLYHRRWIS